YGVPHCMRSLDGNPLRLGGATYIHGVGTHAPSSFTLDTYVGARFARFVADVGVDDEVPQSGSVQFQVWLDGKQAAQSPVMKSGGGAHRMDVDCTGAAQIELRVTDGGDGIKCDHADWAGAMLFAAPPPETIIFDNFNGGLSDKWHATGTAFSHMSWQNPDLFPDQDLPWRGAIVGIEGAGFVNTSNPTDQLRATGKAISPEFTIKLPYIHVKVGGYQLPEAAGVRLVVDGQPVRTGTGIGRKDNTFKGLHKLKHVTWDVREFTGKTGHIEIYDDSAESFVMVDSIVFSSDPEPQYLDIPDVVKIDPQVQAWLEGLVAQERRNGSVPAISCCIVRDGQVMAMAVQGERKLGSGVNAELGDAFQMGSVSKTVTATVAAAMIDEGVMDWTTTLGDVFPELAQAKNPFRNVNVVQLLSHTSGIPQSHFPPQWADMSLNIRSRYAHWIQGYLNLPPQFPPGNAYKYSWGPLVVVTMLSRLTGLSYEQMIRKYLVEPLGLQNTTGVMSARAQEDPAVGFVWQHRVREGRVTAGEPTGFGPPDGDMHGPTGGVNMCPLDQARFMMAHMPGVRAPRLFTNDTIAKLHTPVMDTGAGESYCLGCYTHRDPKAKAFGAAVQHHGWNGAASAHTFIIPEASFGYSVCCNTGGAPPDAYPAALDGVILDNLGRLMETPFRLSMARMTQSLVLPSECPVGLALAAEGRGFYSDWAKHELHSFDTATGEIIWTAPFPDEGPADLAFDGTSLWGGGERTHTLIRFDPKSGEVLGRLPTGDVCPNGLEYAGGRIWVADVLRAELTAFSPRDGSVVGRVTLPRTGLNGLAWDGRYMWAGLTFEKELVALDLQSGKIVCEVTVPIAGRGCRGLEFRDGKFCLNEWAPPSRMDTIEVGQETWDKLGRK
ncbi:MAG: NPCBM/NEW2 domain-containing protein, partial [Armatimonadia bacterium]